MSIALVVFNGYSNGTVVGDIANIVTRGYTIGEVSQVSPCPPTVWTDTAANNSTWQHVNPVSAVWDGGAAQWDLTGNVYEAVWDAKDTVWADAAKTAAVYGQAQDCLKWDNGTVEWDLEGNVYTARWR